MNKLNLHVQKHGGNCDNYILEHVQRYHPRYIKLMDDCVVLASQIKAISPETKVIFRHWWDNPQPHADPNAVLQGIMSTLTQYGATDYVDYIEGTNEPAGTDEELIAKLEADIVVAKHLPKPYLAASFSTGWPDLHFWHYPKVQDLLKQLRDVGANLAIHQYYCPQKEGSWEWETVRHRKFMNVIPEGMKLFVTETGVDCGGPGKGWKTYVSAEEYIDILHRIADEYARDPIIEMAAVFTSCNAGWDTFEVSDLPQHEIWGYEPRVEIPSRIIDDFDRLPKRSPYYLERPLGDISAIVIHHSAVARDLPLEQIANYHINEHGWPGIGYHFVINSDGSIHRVNPINLHSYHALKWGNAHGIGVCLQGNFDKIQPTDAQVESTRWLIQHLNNKLGRNLTIYGHRDTPGVPAGHTHCPGLTWESWKQRLVQQEVVTVANQKDFEKWVPTGVPSEHVVEKGLRWPKVRGIEVLEKYHAIVYQPTEVGPDGTAWYIDSVAEMDDANTDVKIITAVDSDVPRDCQPAAVRAMVTWPSNTSCHPEVRPFMKYPYPTIVTDCYEQVQVSVPGETRALTLGRNYTPEDGVMPIIHWVYDDKSPCKADENGKQGHPSALLVGASMVPGEDHIRLGSVTFRLGRPLGATPQPEPEPTPQPHPTPAPSPEPSQCTESFMCQLLRALEALFCRCPR